MDKFITTENAYSIGKEYFNKRNFVSARKYFDISIKDNRYYEESLFFIVKIDIKEGKFSSAREKLDKYKNTNNLSAINLLGLLENIENNFERSKNYYNMALNSSKDQNILFSLSKLYIQTGEYKLAYKILETLQYYPNSYVQATFDLAILNIMLYNFYEAKSLMKTIDINTLTPKLLHHYKSICTYIKYYLGELQKKKNVKDDYILKRFVCSNDKDVIIHMKRHLNQAYKYSNGCFLENTNLEELLDICKEKIKEMNPNHFELSDAYRFSLDRTIGYKGDIITNDICVSTLLNTKDIITIFPITLSDEFDSEGMSTSECLKIKRLIGGL